MLEVRNHLCRIMQNHTESKFWLWFKLRQISPNLFWALQYVTFQTQFKRENMLKIRALAATLSHIPRVQKPGLRPTALAFLYPRPGQKPAQAKGQAHLGSAFFGFWPQAKAGTSLIQDWSTDILYSVACAEPLLCPIQDWPCSLLLQDANTAPQSSDGILDGDIKYSIHDYPMNVSTRLSLVFSILSNTTWRCTYFAMGPAPSHSGRLTSPTLCQTILRNRPWGSLS